MTAALDHALTLLASEEAQYLPVLTRFILESVPAGDAAVEALKDIRYY
jgi:hypothetical protein